MTSIAIDNNTGEITITFGIPAVNGQTLILVPTVSGAPLAIGVADDILWACRAARSAGVGSAGSINARFVPQVCR